MRDTATHGGFCCITCSVMPQLPSTVYRSVSRRHLEMTLLLASALCCAVLCRAMLC